MVVLAAACHRVPDPGPGDTLPVDYVAPPAASVLTGVAYGPDPEHLIDVYRPPAAGGPAPVIVWLHVGGWLSGSRQQVPELLLRQVDRAGIAIVSADFRRSRFEGSTIVNRHPAPSQDVDRLVRWLRVNGPALGLDDERILVAGASSGGHLAALAGAAPGLHTDPTLPADLLAQDPTPAGVMVVSASLDLAYQVTAPGIEGNASRGYLACSTTPCDPAHVASASPIAQVRADSSPAYIVAGAHDTYVPPPRHATAYVPVLRRAVVGRDAVAGQSSIWYDLVEDGGHNLENQLNTTELERWIDLVLVGTWSG